MKATALPWKRTSLHPLEYRAELDGVTYILRAKWGGFEVAIHRDNHPVEVTLHDTYWHARGHCEADL